MPNEDGIGRPEFPYTPEIANEICFMIATSNKGIHAISKMEGMPSYPVIWGWLNDSTKDFAILYARAKKEQQEFLAEEILEISDDSSGDELETPKGIIENKEFVNRSRLKVDTRKWLMSKLAPKKYGDKIDVTTNGENINAPVVIDWSGNYNPTNTKTD